MKTLVLSVNDLSDIVRYLGLNRLMDEAIDRLASAFRDYDPGKHAVPVRDGFTYDAPKEGLLEWMPAMTLGERVTMKIVGYHPTNPDCTQLPTIISSSLSFDTSTGHLTGIVDGTFMTALRTGAASAVASRVLSDPQSSTLGIIGCGAQALTQLHAISRIFELKEVLLYDIDPSVSGDFCARTAVLGLQHVRMRPAPLQHVIRSADILCTATSIAVGSGPVFQDCDLKTHIHVNAVGSDFPGKTELPVSLLARSFVCPDFRAQAMKEGECQQLVPEALGPDLAELVKNTETYRSKRRVSTVFDSTGWALEDHVISGMLFEYADSLKCGTMVELESIGSDPRNPYGFAVDVEAYGKLPLKRMIRH